MSWLSFWPNWLFVFSLMVGGGLSLLALIGSDHDHDGDLDAESPFFAILGQGKVPFSIALQILLLSFGSYGLLLNVFGHYLFGATAIGLLFPLTIVTTFFLSIVTTTYMATWLATLAPADQATARIPGEFVGCTGTAITSITYVIGQVRVQTDTGPDAILNARLSQERACLIQRDATVSIVAYDGLRNLYLVKGA